MLASAKAGRKAAAVLAETPAPVTGFQVVLAFADELIALRDRLQNAVDIGVTTMIEEDLEGALQKLEMAIGELWPAVGFLRSIENDHRLSLEMNHPETIEQLRVALEGGAS